MIKFFDEKAPSLDEAQKVVGGYVETVELGNGDIMLVNEEGLIKELEPNPEAIAMCGRFIVGDVAIVKSEVRGDDW